MKPLEAGEIHRLRGALAERGWASDVEWSESIQEPSSAEDFAREAIFVICNSGMRFSVAQGIFERVMAALEKGSSARVAFGHPGKCAAIDLIWAERERLLAEYLAAPDKLEFCESMPWIGGITKYHLAKNFGAPVAKPDVHLKRLADAHGCSAQELCERLAEETGLKVPTIDTILWRASAIGLLPKPRLQL